MASNPAVTEEKDEAEEVDGKPVLDKKVAGSLSLNKYELNKIGKREKGTEAVKYQTWQIAESSATDPASLVEDVLSFLNNDFAAFKRGLIAGANQQARFIDSPKPDPLEAIDKLMSKAGITPEMLLEFLSKK